MLFSYNGTFHTKAECSVYETCEQCTSSCALSVGCGSIMWVFIFFSHLLPTCFFSTLSASLCENLMKTYQYILRWMTFHVAFLVVSSWLGFCGVTIPFSNSTYWKPNVRGRVHVLSKPCFTFCCCQPCTELSLSFRCFRRELNQNSMSWSQQSLSSMITFMCVHISGLHQTRPVFLIFGHKL